MRVAVNEIDGIDSVEVSLNRGVVVIRLRPENRVTLAGIRDAIRERGFTPKEAEVRARGTVVDDGGHLALAMPGSAAVIRLVADSQAPGVIGELEGLLGQDVTVDGRVAETARGAREPAVLRARVLSKSAPS